MAKKRGFANPRTDKHLVRNQSTRSARVQALCIHSTESHPRPGDADLDAIQSWFDNPASQASSHYCIDDQGRSRQMVEENRKAWTCGAANSLTVNYELIGFAAWTRKTWRSYPKQLRKLAQHIAYSSIQWGVPIQRGRVGNAGGVCVITRPGVIKHADVSKAGFGTHTDPGRFFPMTVVLQMARYYRRRGWYPGRPAADDLPAVS